MKLLVQIALAGSLTALSLGLARAQDTFDFENQAAYIAQSITAAPVVAAESPSARTLTLSQSGLGPTSSGFTYVDNNGGGTVIYGSNLTNVAIGNGGDGTALETLKLTFDQAVTGLTFQFVTYPANANSPIELNALTDTGMSMSGIASVQNLLGNGEGSLTLSGLGAFSSLSLSLNVTPVMGGVGAAVGDSFIVDNFVVLPPVRAVPEPGALALFAGVAVPFAWRLRRRR